MKNISKFIVLTAITVLLFSGDLDESTQFGFRIIQDAEARVGRPLTPVSVAGVRRRTRRRTYRHAAVGTAVVVGTAAVVAAPSTTYVTPVTTTYVEPAPTTTVIVESAPASAVPMLAVGTVLSALPTGCTSVTVAGASYFDCNGTYLKPALQGDSLAYMVVDNPN